MTWAPLGRVIDAATPSRWRRIRYIDTVWVAEAVRIALVSLGLYRQPELKTSTYGDVASSVYADYLLRAEELGIEELSPAERARAAVAQWRAGKA